MGGRRREKRNRGLQKGITMCQVHGSTFCKDCKHHTIQTNTNKEEKFNSVSIRKTLTAQIQIFQGSKLLVGNKYVHFKVALTLKYF